MTTADDSEIHQAVFGYSNGHRLLASSIQLASIDSYELAAASDLAPGVVLSGSDSYLTGVTLPESKLYALIRTWAAPEMQRPGCVWSHVLLVSRNVLASQLDLGILNSLFKQPAKYENDKYFDRPLAISRRDRSKPPSKETVEKVLAACYTGPPVSIGSGTRVELEKAILAVWSQQWPRLRSNFIFRSVLSKADLPGQMLKHSLDKYATSGNDSEWLHVASDDAVSTKITELRRFLWRYGKDIDVRLEPFVDLLNIYIATRRSRPSFRLVEAVFAKLGQGQALTLKRDLLGLSDGKAAYVQGIQAPDLIELLSDEALDEIQISDQEISGLFQDIAADQFSAVVSSLQDQQASLGNRYDIIFEAVLPQIDEASLSSRGVPPSFLITVLARREDLISPELLSHLPDQEIGRLANPSSNKFQVILSAVLSRPAQSFNSNVIKLIPSITLKLAVQLSLSQGLDDGWREQLRQANLDFVPSVPELLGGREIFEALKLLAFPLAPPNAAEIWWSAFLKGRGSFDSAAETTFLVFLFSLCVHHGLSANRSVAAHVIADLRARILSGSLSNEDEKMLGRWLPHHSENWDLNKRLLKLFRQRAKSGENFGDLLSLLGLSNHEYAYATNQDPDNLVRQVMRAVMPWGSWGD